MAPARLALLVDATPDQVAEVKRRQDEDLIAKGLVRSYVDELVRASQLDENGRVSRAASEALARAEALKAKLTTAQLEEASRAIYAIRQDRAR